MLAHSIVSGAGRLAEYATPEGLEKLRQRFEARVDRDGPIVGPGLGQCWVWTGSRTRSGYASIYTRVNGRRSYTLAHRVAWYLEHGSLPDTDIVQVCGVRHCVRCSHLVDTEHRITGLVLTDDDVRAMRFERAAVDGGPRPKVRDLAAKYGISVGAASLILNGRRRRLDP